MKEVNSKALLKALKIGVYVIFTALNTFFEVVEKED